MADDREMEEWRAKVEQQNLYYRAGIDTFLLSERAAVDLGIEALRNAVLLNGGAAIALLAFMSGGGTNAGVQSGIKCGVILFAVGALAAGIAASVSYLYQSFDTENIRRRIGKDDGFKVPEWLTKGRQIALVSMLALAAVSYGLFVAGAIVSALAFDS